MSKLHLLGTGSGLLSPGRNASSYLLETEEGDILFDAGEPVSITLTARNYDWRRLQAVMISHTHPDHMGGFPLLIQQIHLSRRKEKLHIYAPSEYTGLIYEHLGIHYLFPDYFSFEFKAFNLGKEKIFLGKAEVTPIETEHLTYVKEKITPGYPNMCEAFSFKVKIEDRTVLYSADIKSFSEIEKHLFGCNYALIETTHIELASVMEWAGKNPSCKIIITHISPDFNMEEFKITKEKWGLKNITLARDGQRI